MENMFQKNQGAGKILPTSFHDRPSLDVARDLLGARLVRLLDGERLVGVIVECEAYIGEDDQACHARHGKTARTAVMYGPPGHAYVYFTYGMHWMLNIVTERQGFPAAVLLRGIIPVEGVEIMSARRKGRDTLGPGKLTQALGIDGRQNGISLYNSSSGLWVEEGTPIPQRDIVRGPRVGLFTVPEPWKSLPWRLQAKIR
jgi:DNA-3-methyladenine glycosylase